MMLNLMLVYSYKQLPVCNSVAARAGLQKQLRRIRVVRGLLVGKPRMLKGQRRDINNVASYTVKLCSSKVPGQSLAYQGPVINCHPSRLVGRAVGFIHKFVSVPFEAIK